MGRRINSTPHLSTHVRVQFFDGDCFREDLLGLTLLEGPTAGEIIFQRIVAFFLKTMDLIWRMLRASYRRCSSVAGRVKGLSTQPSAITLRMKSLHCLISQSVLCAQLSGELKNSSDYYGLSYY